MIYIFRKNQRVLMAVIAFLTIVSFIWFFNPGQGSGGQIGEQGGIKIYDRILPQADIEREVKTYVLARALSQYELLAALGGTGENEDLAVQEFVLNLLVLRHQAEALGVVPTPLEEARRLQSLPAFQTNGQYDFGKYSKFVEENLGPRGLTEDRLYALMGDAIRVERLREIVGAPAAVAPSELADAAVALQPVDIEVIRFPVVEAGIEVSNEEVNAAYEQFKNAFVAPETRSVQYVEFASPEPLPEDPKAKIEVQQKLADAADKFAREAAATTFERAAGAAGLTVKSTPELDRSGQTATPSTDAEGKEDFGPMAAAAFLLGPDKPVSDVVQSGDRFYVVKLANVTPQKQQTLEEVRPMIETQLKGMKAGQQLRTAAQAAVGKLQQALAGGRPFADAVQEAGLKSESIKAIDPSDMNGQPEQLQFARSTALLKPGQLSGTVRSEDGLAAVYLVERKPLDPAKFKEREEEMKTALLDNKQTLLFLSWLAQARAEAKITPPQAPGRPQ